jgi:hypothetical protein
MGGKSRRGAAEKEGSRRGGDSGSLEYNHKFKAMAFCRK